MYCHIIIVGRFTVKPVHDLRQFIKFQSLVNHVEYSKNTDDFIVRIKEQPTSRETTERFTHAIVASGTFAYAEKPSFPGLSKFKGRILHSQDIKHMDAFRNQKILIIGARWSAEDLALQAFKYGAEHAIISWRTMPHGQDWFEFPEGIEQRPLVEKVDSKSAWFKDGTTAEVNSIILCTGYRWHFPFLAEDLRVPGLFFCSRDFYKWTLWLNGGNNKLMYIGAPYNFYTLTLIEAQHRQPWFGATVKPVLCSHSKIDKTKVLKANGRLMKVESIAECSTWSVLQYF